MDTRSGLAPHECESVAEILENWADERLNQLLILELGREAESDGTHILVGVRKVTLNEVDHEDHLRKHVTLGICFVDTLQEQIAQLFELEIFHRESKSEPSDRVRAMGRPQE